MGKEIYNLQGIRLQRRENARKARKKVNKARASGKHIIYAPRLPAEMFYACDAWLALRYVVLVKRGARCECCGATARDDVRIHVDHVKPRSRFPLLELEEDNLQVLCEPCNQGKSNKDATDWRPAAPLPSAGTDPADKRPAAVVPLHVKASSGF